jgi:DNA-binding MarR family transcriptional regulator
MIRIYQNGISIEVDTVTEAAQLLRGLEALSPRKETVVAPAADNGTALLTPVQHETLQYLQKNGDTTAGDLAAHTGINRSAAAFRLRQLVILGVAERVSRGVYGEPA